MRDLAALLFLALTLLAPSAAAQDSPRGVWFDRTRPGHGVDVQQIGSTLLAIVYTYGADGEPEWFAAQGDFAPGRLDAPLLAFRAGPGATLPASATTVGRFTFSLGADAAAEPCRGTARPSSVRLAVLELGVGAERTLWCLEPLVPALATATSAMSGTWFAGGSDSGWGLTSYFLPAPATGSFHLAYYYGADGAPRWAIAESGDPDFALEAGWIAYRGYCRSCAPIALTARDAGRLSLRLSSPRPDAWLDNRIETSLAYPGPGGGRFDRSTRLLRLSDFVAPPRTVATREGIAEGRPADGNTVAWFALPYAAPPTGALRLRAPQPAPARTAVVSAAGFGAACPQADSSSFFGAAPARQDEDCLTLNVWTPATPGSRRPVMVWIHGGGHIQGASGQIAPNGQVAYDGSQFARRDVVLVSINYRLGALGYAAFRELIGEFPEQPGAGNYGLLDQIAALAWVRDNIAAFGGDPGNVTIFGESAGGVSVCALVASPLARGLFQRALVQSGNCRLALSRLSFAVGSAEAAVDQGERIKQRLGCTGPGVAACLRSKSPAEFVAAQQGAIFTQDGEGYEEVIDGHALLENPGDALLNGRAAPVPLLIGVNEDEATTLVPSAQRPQTAAAYEALVRTSLPAAITGAVLSQYPAAAYDPVWRAYTAIVSDVSFICPARRAAREHAAAGRPVYAYYFTQTLPQTPTLGAFHAIEIPFLFTAMSQNDAAIQAMAATMKDLWVAYARTGVPAAPGVPAWPLHAGSGAIGLEFRADGFRVRSDYRREFCDFWQRTVGRI